MDYMKDVTLNEKDSLQDMLNLEKNLVKVYSTVMTEGVTFKCFIINDLFKRSGEHV